VVVDLAQGMGDFPHAEKGRKKKRHEKLSNK